MAVCRQGIYVDYSVEYSKCRALNGILVSTVELKSKAFLAVDSAACYDTTTRLPNTNTWYNTLRVIRRIRGF
eukprot:7107919-Pyramimonas_sp.AAC.3